MMKKILIGLSIVVAVMMVLTVFSGVVFASGPIRNGQPLEANQNSQSTQTTLTIEQNYTVSSSLGSAQIGSNGTISTTFGFVNVTVSHDTITLVMTMNTGQKKTSVSISPDTTYVVYTQQFYKSGSNWIAYLDVAQVETLSLATMTLAEILEAFGAIVENLLYSLVSVAPWAGLEAFSALVVILTANFGVVDAYALSRNAPSVYFEVGASLWEGFYPAVYGEEGTYSGYVSDFNDGSYWPVANMSGTWASMQQHDSVWNPAVMPPWGV